MIFCVEDDAAIRDLMIYALNASGFEAAGFADGEGLFAALRESKPDLIMLDIMLPGEDGIAILKRLKSREHTRNIPVIMASAKGTEYDKVIGLDLGADDYLAKPYATEELLARIRALLRRHGSVRSSGFCRGDVELFRQKGRLKGPAGECTVSNREAALLYLFLSNPGQVLSRETILMRIWGQEREVEQRNIDNFVYLIRRRLANVGSAIAIHTVRGCGYRAEV